MTAALNRIIHSSFRAAGIVEDDDKRALYDRVAGERELSKMTDAKKQLVINELRRLGAAPAKAKRSAKDTVSGKYGPVVRAFWLSGYNLGVIRDPDDRAIHEFVRGQTKIEHTNWVHDPDDAKAVIEAIKAWVRREGDLPDLWRPVSKINAWRNDAAVQVVFAQWEILRRLDSAPAASIYDWSGNPGRMVSFVNIDRAVLVEMQKHLGRLIRFAKGGA